MTSIKDIALSQLALAADGVVGGVTLAFVAIHYWRKYICTSSVLERIRHAKTVPISGLSALITESSSDDEKLVFVRGFVQAKSAIDVSVRPNVLVCSHSGAKGVVLLESQTCIYNDSIGVFDWVSSFDFRRILFGDRPRIAASPDVVPFVLVGDESSCSEYVDVDMDTLTHPLPLTRVYHHFRPFPAIRPYTFLPALLDPIGFLEEEKLLPLGKEISAVGTCISDNGNLKMRSCEDLPYFLSELTKDEMSDDLSRVTNALFWTSIVLGTVSLAILGYTARKSWQRWKERRRIEQSRDDLLAEEENEEIPEGQLCVVCLMRRKRFAFVPCGCYVCCPRCALSVERYVAPKCPLCRQKIRFSLRILES